MPECRKQYRLGAKMRICDLRRRIHYRFAVKVRIWAHKALQKEPPPQEAQRFQGHQNEFRSTLACKVLEKIVMIWTPAKTMNNTSQTSQAKEVTKRPPQKVQNAPARDTKMSFGARWLINCAGKLTYFRHVQKHRKRPRPPNTFKKIQHFLMKS